MKRLVAKTLTIDIPEYNQKADYEKTFSIENVHNIRLEMNLMEQLVAQEFDIEFVCVFTEIKEILSYIVKTEK